LEKVADDVDVHAEQIGKVEVGVAGTKVVLKKVHKEVKEQGEDIKEVKAGVEEVNERVDVVEDDLEETKVKVEEVDKKVRFVYCLCC
jgi:archaellum component FlaC